MAVESRELRFYNGPTKVSTALPLQDDLSNVNVSEDGATATLSAIPTFFSQLQFPLVGSSQQQQQQQQQGVSATSSNTETVGYAASFFQSSNPNNNNDNNSNQRPSFSTNSSSNPNSNPKSSSFTTIDLTPEEEELFNLLKKVIQSTSMNSTLRVAGGWVRDKLLATEEFKNAAVSNRREDSSSSSSSSTASLERLTSKFKGPSMGRQGTKVIGSTSSTSKIGNKHNNMDNSNTDDTDTLSLLSHAEIPVDIDIALDDMLGREFADHLNEWLSQQGRETISVGVVLKNPEKSKHLETATMKVGNFWIDFVNLRAEEYSEDSRIPDLMRIGTAQEDALRRDLTINALFYNINNGQVEDLTGRGLEDLRKSVVSTPLPALTTLLDDPLRVLRSVRFAARLRFTMEDSLKNAAMDERVRVALSQKVARERIGSEVDLMLRSQDPVGAMRLLLSLKLASTVFPAPNIGEDGIYDILEKGLRLISSTHGHLCFCKMNTPLWCQKKLATAAATNGVDEVVLMDDEETRRLLWYASFLKPVRDHFQVQKSLQNEDEDERPKIRSKKANRSAILKLLVDELKRPGRDAESVELIMKTADDFTNLVNMGCDLSATTCLLGEIRIQSKKDNQNDVICRMGSRIVDSETEDDPIWLHAMEFRLLVSKVLCRAGSLWRAALILSLSEQLTALEEDQFSYTIEGDVFEETNEEVQMGIIAKYDNFAACLMQLGLVGIWSEKPLIDGREVKSEGVLPKLPNGPVFKEVMEDQKSWMITHPGGKKEGLIDHLHTIYPEFVQV